ncbi:unnamed protein product [Clonostachys byssicola]|uniref:Carboxylic ester hydrolase n=1 Tax=Clonostachys byssicola TaxID=160290 RepID=A0A9N9US78_9HYPO|nr:unnamed protein product [Clonostachys byssicola]
MIVSHLLHLFLLVAVQVSAVPTAVLEGRAKVATATISSPSATLLGNVNNGVEQFGGVPFAEGNQRLQKPKRLTSPLGTVDATGAAGACPQMIATTDDKDFLQNLLGSIANLPFVQEATGQSEDCLSITVARPEGTKAGDNLPVLFWIFGGGFQLGWSSMYDGEGLVNYAKSINKPIVFVAVNYRVAGYGFLAGKEVKAAGVGNLGLLDQRMGLEWVADNIAAFGGDPEKVTIWGESAGAISVYAQMALYDGDHTYKGKPLFRGAIMNSGSVVPVEPIDGKKGQAVYDQVVKAGGCSGNADTLNCLRGLSYTAFLNAVTSVPGILSYNSLALSYLPRPDGVSLTDSPDALVAAGKYAAVPMIIGDQEDEGTLFALFQSNLTTNDRLVNYLKSYFFDSATTAQLNDLVNAYGNGLTAVIDGSPFNTGLLNEIFIGFKRRAAIMGDLVFTLARRVFLATANTVNPNVPSWSYLASYDQGTPILGTLHGSDLIQVFFGIKDNYAAKGIRAYYINFVYSLDPNEGRGSYPEWPRWSETNKLLHFFADKFEQLDDNFRSAGYNWLVKNINSLRY